MKIVDAKQVQVFHIPARETPQLAEEDLGIVNASMVCSCSIFR